MISKGDRIAMPVHSVETRYPFTSTDVINFCGDLAGLQTPRREPRKWITLRQVATAKTLPPAPDTPITLETMFRASMAKTFLRPARPPGSISSSASRSRKPPAVHPKVVARRER